MMKMYEFKINDEFSHLLFSANEGKNISGLVKVVHMNEDDPRFPVIGELDKKIKKKFGSAFILSWSIKYKYLKSEIEDGKFFLVMTENRFEPAGEECGTYYDDTKACTICGSNAKKVGPLILKGDSIPFQDIACSIAGEFIVSEKTVNKFEKYNLKGIHFSQVEFIKKSSRKFYEIFFTSPELRLTKKTFAGVTPFDFSEKGEAEDCYIEEANYHFKSDEEIYKCPKGHLIGLRLLSEPYLKKEKFINNFDFFATKEKIGVRRGLLRPESLYICSKAFREMAIKEKLVGLKFIRANL